MIHRFLIVIIIIISSCDKKNEFKNTSINIPNYNHSKYHINFETTKQKKVQISYWDDENNKLFSRINNSSKHDIALPFLKPSTKYSFKINSSSSYSPLYTFQTRDLPDFFPTLELKKDSSFSFDGYLLFKTQTNPGIHFMIDDLGNIVWYSVADSTLSRPFNLGNNFSYLSQSNKNIFHEIRYDGDTIFSKNTKENTLHHDILINDSIYVALTYEYINHKGNGFDSIMGDGIVVYDNEGDMIWKWNIFDHVDPLSEKYIIREDWSHANAIDVDKDGSYLVSFRNFDQIWKINSKSGDIIWRLGINGDFKFEEDDFFYQQHAIHKIDNEKYMLFDNGSSEKRMTSRALIFNIDEDDKKYKMSKSVFLPDNLFSFKQGSVYMIENDKYLFASSVNNKTVITNENGEILWNLSSDKSFYRVYYVDNKNLFSKINEDRVKVLTFPFNIIDELF